MQTSTCCRTCDRIEMVEGEAWDIGEQFLHCRELPLCEGYQDVFPNRFFCALHPNFNIGRTAELTHFYADLPIGTKGKIIKQWDKWVRLYFGKNTAGQPLRKAIPKDCIKIIY